MSNFKTVVYTDASSAHGSSVIDVEIGRSTGMIGVNKSGLKTGNIVAVVNSQNNLTQVVRVVSKEHYAQPWKVDYKNVYNVEVIAEDVSMPSNARKELHLNDSGVHTQWPTVSAQEEYVKTALANLS